MIDMFVSFANMIKKCAYVKIDDISYKTIYPTKTPHDILYVTKTIAAQNDVECEQKIIEEIRQSFKVDVKNLISHFHLHIQKTTQNNELVLCVDKNNTTIGTFGKIDKFVNDLSVIKTKMYNFNLIDDDENNSIIYDLDIDVRYKADYNNRVLNIYSKKPITITPTLIPELNEQFYLISVSKNMLDDNILTDFYNPTLNQTVKQFVFSVFKIGDRNDDTADIKLDYINRIDTIDELNIKLKLSNIIKQ